MKIAVTGKGGVGKTTLAGALARTFAQRGWRVIALDADPDANLSVTLPLDSGQITEIVPLAARRELLQERAGISGMPTGFFLLNPSLDGLPVPTVTWGGGNQLVVMGWSARGGQGCYCAENTVLQCLLQSLLADPEELIIVDSEPGLEHLSRGTTACVDVVLAVLEPGQRSIDTAQSIRILAGDMGIPFVFPVLCGYRSTREIELIRQGLGDWPLLAAFPYDEDIRIADLEGHPPEFTGEFAHALEGLAIYLESIPLFERNSHLWPIHFHTHVDASGRVYTHSHGDVHPHT